MKDPEGEHKAELGVERIRRSVEAKAETVRLVSFPQLIAALNVI